MSKFTEAHQQGVNAFTQSLLHKEQTCSNCGFHDTVLHSDWRTHVETDHRSGHIQYQLTCPDCQTEEVLDIDI
jgi:Zn ribbon nucleic-acid-binding protein